MPTNPPLGFRQRPAAPRPSAQGQTKSRPTERLAEVLLEARALADAVQELFTQAEELSAVAGTADRATILTLAGNLLNAAAKGLTNQRAILEAEAYLRVNARKNAAARDYMQRLRAYESTQAEPGADLPTGLEDVPRPEPTPDEALTQADIEQMLKDAGY